MQLILPLAILGLMMYMIVLRPQRRLKAQRATLMAALAPGDEIVTIGGLYARVEELDATTVDLEIAEGIIVRFDRRAISTIVPKPVAQSDEDDLDDDEDGEDDDEDGLEAVGEASDPVSDSTR